MIKMQSLAVAIGFSLFSAVAVASSSSFFQDRERGWFWYEDPPPEPEEEVLERSAPAVAASAAAASAQPLSAREQLKRQGEQMEEALSLAVMNPTPENILNYLEHSKRIQKQAQNFATEFKQTLWTAPEYDYRLEKPVTTDAIMAVSERSVAEQDARLVEIADKYGLIFFMRSDCPYCHKFGPVLKGFAEKYGVEVIPVSLDGPGIPDYPYPKPNIDLGRKLNVSVVPALFLVDPDRNKVVTVGYGFNDWSALTAKMIYAADAMETDELMVTRK